jgi:hypothetical protein
LSLDSAGDGGGEGSQNDDGPVLSKKKQHQKDYWKAKRDQKKAYKASLREAQAKAEEAGKQVCPQCRVSSVQFSSTIDNHY